VSIPINNNREFRKCELAPLAGEPDRDIQLYAIDSTYAESIYDEFYVPTGYDPSINFPYNDNIKKRDGIAGLFTKDGLSQISQLDKYNVTTNEAYRDEISLGDLIGKEEVRVVIPSGLAVDASIPVGTPGLMKVGSTRFRARIRHTAQKMPGFFFTGY